jgi:hypothetical protein
VLTGCLPCSARGNRWNVWKVWNCDPCGSELLLKIINRALTYHSQLFDLIHRTKILALAKIWYWRRFWHWWAPCRASMQLQGSKTCMPASMHLKKSMCPVPFCSGPV